MKRLKITAGDLAEALGGIDEKWFDTALEPLPKRENRHFVAYEMNKLFGVKYLWVFLAIFLLLNSFIALFTAGKTNAAREPSQLIADFFAEYESSPDELTAYYDKLLAFNEEQSRLFAEAMSNGNFNFKPETLPDVYSTDENYSDMQLFSKLFEAIEAAADYPEVMQKVIDRAYSNLEEFGQMGIAADSFTYRYQLRVIKLYESVRDNVRPEVIYTRGWGEYFDYTIVDLFIFFLLIMLGSVMFAEEKQSGILPIIRTSKNGRARTAAAKILTALIFTWFVTLIFTASTFAVYGLRLGYSSPSNALQSLSEFTLSPYKLTIGEYFAVTIGVKLLAFSLFTLVILAVSTIFYNYIMIYLCGLGFFGLNFLLYTLKYIDSSNPAKNLNLVAVAAVNPIFVRYRAVNLFGNVAGYLPFMLSAFLLLSIGCILFTTLRFVRGGEFRPSFLDPIAGRIYELSGRAKNAVRNIALPEIRRNYSMSLFSAEVYKTLISSRFILVVILLLIVKCAYSVDTNSPVRSYADSVYKEYMTLLEGELTDEKREFLTAEREMIESTLSRQTTMQQAYVNDEITFDEYRQYLSDYNYAFSRSELLKIIESHADYLEKKESTTGIKGWFAYDTGWKKLYSGDADLFLYTAILLLLNGSFASEYLSRSSSGGFSQILRATKNGRNRTFYAKLISSGTIAATLTVLFNAVDIAVIFGGYDMAAFNAPLVSIEYFGAVKSDITIGGYLAVFLLLRLAASLIMAMLVCALSELLCRYIPVLGSVAVLTLLPALFAYFGLAAADKISFLNLLAGTPLYLESANMSLFGNGWAMLALWIVAAGAAVWAMLVPAKRMFVR